MSSAMAIKLCVTPRHGSTKPLRKNKRDGNEAILSTPGSVMRSDKQRTGVGKLHYMLMKPRPNGTLALLRAVGRTMMPRERTML
jgi:hypothetical protein